MSETLNDQAADLLARRLVATALAAALSPPPTADEGGTLPVTPFALRQAWRLTALAHAALKRSELQRGELLPAETDIEPLAKWLGLEPARRARAQQNVFGLVISKHCPTCETERLASGDAFYRAQVMADITGFYRAFGVEVDARRPQRPDHIALELEFSAFLLAKLADSVAEGTAEREEICRAALAAFVRDHLAAWVADFGQLVARCAAEAARDLPTAERSDVRLLGCVGHVLCAWIAMERRFAGVAPLRRVELPSLVEAADLEPACSSCECD